MICISELKLLVKKAIDDGGLLDQAIEKAELGEWEVSKLGN